MVRMCLCISTLCLFGEMKVGISMHVIILCGAMHFRCEVHWLKAVRAHDVAPSKNLRQGKRIGRHL